MGKAYFNLIKKTFLNNIVYPVETIMGILNMVFSIFVYVSIWQALYVFNGNLSGTELKMVITHFVISLGLATIFLETDDQVEQKVRDGGIATDLIKPINFNSLILCQTLGKILFRLSIQFLPAVAVSVVFIGIYPPSSVVSLLLFLLSIVLGFLIIYLLNYIISLTSFWILNTWSLVQVKNALVVILSGVYLPLQFLPRQLQTIIGFTPFRYIFYAPIQIYLGKSGIAEITMDFLLQAFWVLGLFAISQILWWRGIKKLVIQGG